MQKTFNFFYAFLLAIFGVGVTLMAEEITLTTYYPAPYGAYEELTVSGKVGIGTTEPTNELSFGATFNKAVISMATVDGSDNKLLQITGAGNAGFTRGAWINLYGNDYGGADNAGLIEIITGNTGNDRILFYTGESERMRIASDGDVGIGTSDPQATLDVNGTIAVSGTPGASGSFLSGDGGTVTVTNGIITNITPP